MTQNKNLLAALMLLCVLMLCGSAAFGQVKRPCSQYLSDSASASLLGKAATTVNKDGQYSRDKDQESLFCHWGTKFPPHVPGAPEIYAQVDLQVAQHASAASLKQAMLPWPTGPKIKLEKISEFGPEGVFFQDSGRNVAMVMGNKGLKVFSISVDMGLVKALPADVRSKLMQAGKTALSTL
jgi:hypothetical protein